MEERKNTTVRKIALDYVITFFVLFVVGYILEFFLIGKFRDDYNLRLVRDIIEPIIFIWLASSYAGGAVSRRYFIDDKSAVIRLIMLQFGVILGVEFLLKSGYIFTRLGSFDYPKSKTLWHYGWLIFTVGLKGYMAWFFAKKYLLGSETKLKNI